MKKRLLSLAPVSYTHLDVYKRQELESAGNMADNLQMLGASMDKANSIDDTPVMDLSLIHI